MQDIVISLNFQSDAHGETQSLKTPLLVSVLSEIFGQVGKVQEKKTGQEKGG